MHFELTLSSTPGHAAAAAPLASLVKQRSYVKLLLSLPPQPPLLLLNRYSGSQLVDHPAQTR